MSSILPWRPRVLSVTAASRHFHGVQDIQKYFRASTAEIVITNQHTQQQIKLLQAKSQGAVQSCSGPIRAAADSRFGTVQPCRVCSLVFTLCVPLMLLSLVSGTTGLLRHGVRNLRLRNHHRSRKLSRPKELCETAAEHRIPIMHYRVAMSLLQVTTPSVLLCRPSCETAAAGHRHRYSSSTVQRQ